MPRFALPALTLRKILVLAAFVFAAAWLQTPLALAQRPGGHVGGAGRIPAPHVVAPPVFHPAIPRPGFVPARPLTGFRGPNFGFDGRPIYIFPHPFFGPRRFLFAQNLWFSSFAWLTCGPFWGWEVGCDGLPLSNYNFEAYAAPPVYQPPAYVYVYGRGGSDLVQLFLNDGSVVSVTDYWFVNGEVHYTVPDEARGKLVEQVIALDELDLQKTIDVNTRRGFRFVMRNEPWRQFLRDHPDVTPPDVPPPPKK